MTTTTNPGLSADDRKLLRAPFGVTAVKWVPIGGVSERGVLMQPHINASLVFERLSDVDPGWTHDTNPMLLGANPEDPFGLVHMSPWKCTMTVKGVTRHGIGQLGPGGSRSNPTPPKADNMHLKTGYSDAIKRAALEFEVGAYLRAFDTVWLPRQEGGQDTFKTRSFSGKESFTGLTAAGKRVLRAHYEKVVTHELFKARYGDPIEYGDDAVDDDADDHEAGERVAEPGSASDGEMNVLVLLSGYTGRNTSEDYVRTTYEGKPFAKSLAALLTAVRAHLEVNATDVDRLRTLAQAAAGGDEAAMGELGDGLVQLKALASAGAPEGDEQEAMPV